MDIFAAAKGPNFHGGAALAAPPAPDPSRRPYREGRGGTAQPTGPERRLWPRAGHAPSDRREARGKAPPSAALLPWRGIIYIGGCLYDACGDGDIGAIYEPIKNSRPLSSWFWVFWRVFRSRFWRVARGKNDPKFLSIYKGELPHFRAFLRQHGQSQRSLAGRLLSTLKLGYEQRLILVRLYSVKQTRFCICFFVLLFLRFKFASVKQSYFAVHSRVQRRDL